MVMIIGFTFVEGNKLATIIELIYKGKNTQIPIFEFEYLKSESKFWELVILDRVL
jgi:hypothetical protein